MLRILETKWDTTALFKRNFEEFYLEEIRAARHIPLNWEKVTCFEFVGTGEKEVFVQKLVVLRGEKLFQIGFAEELLWDLKEI